MPPASKLLTATYIHTNNTYRCANIVIKLTFWVLCPPYPLHDARPPHHGAAHEAEARGGGGAEQVLLFFFCGGGIVIGNDEIMRHLKISNER